MTDPSATDTPKRTAYSSPESSRGGLNNLSVPRMGAESGFQLVSEDEVPPLRASGIVCFVLGALSFWALIAWQMIIIPVLAIIFGIIAMRKWGSVRPAGTTVAVIGLVLASVFGAVGVMLPTMKQQTLGKQAEYFAHEFLELCGEGEMELALELQKRAPNRQLANMNLKEAYAEDDVANSQMEEADNGLFETISAAGPDIEWELAESARVYFKYGIEKADTYWIDPSGKIKGKIQVQLEWHPNEDERTGQWHVALFQTYRDRIVAPSIL